MRKILFITSPKIKGMTGGTICSERNLHALKEVFGKDCVDVYVFKSYEGNYFKSSLLYYFNVIKGLLSGLTSDILCSIDEEVRFKGYTDIFIDTSKYGIIAKVLKNKYPNLKVHTFFHNIEYVFTKSSIKVNKMRYKLILNAIRYNENCACAYSDTIICLNKRDSLLLAKHYHRNADLLIPITIKDNYSYDVKLKFNEKRKGLFLGSYFFGNIDGLIWFCKEVMPLLDIELSIVGTNMDKLHGDLTINDRIHIFSNVLDLKPFFEDADFMVFPIISGGGMKVKTAEALMYGKYIIGSTESLIGYDVDNNVACVCESKEDYVNAVRDLEIKYKFNHSSRALYLEKYSYPASISQFYKLL